MENTAKQDWDSGVAACSCGHCHHENATEHDESSKERGGARSIIDEYGLDILGAVVYALAFFMNDETFRAGLFIIAYLLLGWQVIWTSARGLGGLFKRNGSASALLDENFLMTIATIGALCIGEFPEAGAVMLLYRIGETLQERAVNASKRSIRALMDLRPDSANLLDEDGTTRAAEPADVRIGQRILVRPGERIPLDGVVIEGECALDTAALTGESQPRAIMPGGEALSGSIVVGGTLTIEVTRIAGDSTVSKILELAQSASSKKTRAELLITRFARVYTPAVVGAAVLLALIPAAFGMPLAGAVRRALVFLVISCPCALVISIPLGYFAGLGAASRRGILVKGARYFESLCNVDSVVFDKTGTLTRGVFEVARVETSNGIGKDELMEAAAYAEWDSSHPIARSIKSAWGGTAEPSRLAERTERAGYGVRVLFDGRAVLAGHPRLLDEAAVNYPPFDSGETSVAVAVDGKYWGRIILRDAIKLDAASAIKRLRELGVREISMLTGDTPAAAESVRAELGLDSAEWGLLPHQKMEALERRMAAKSGGGAVVFVGDGINDAPVLARADVGVAMGGIGSDAAIEAADVALMTDEPSRVAELICIARRTRRIGIQNIALALGVKAVLMVFGAFGWTPLWLAVFGDVGVALLAVANAMRASRTGVNAWD
ncbi:cadmium transporter [Clostridia bacterium]|nr:cadmium transporter [Clostridia bacterium]